MAKNMVRLSSSLSPPPPPLPLLLPPSCFSPSSSSSSSSNSSKRLRILEVNLISVEGLKQSKKKLNTYAVLWIRTGPKIRTQVLRDSGPNPTWNDQFLFWVPEDFINSEHSYVAVEIYNRRRCRKELLGSVTALLSTAREHGNVGSIALQVKSPWDEQEAMLNIKMAVWNLTTRFVGDFELYWGMKMEKKKIDGIDGDDNQKADRYPRRCF